MEYEAGPELDRLIAERVLRGKSGPLFHEHVLPYSTDIAAAWRVIAACHHRESPLLYEIVDLYDWWRVHIYGPGHTVYAEQYAHLPSVPLAICRAALQAVARASLP
jgi:hypothetical protein